jgi:hypothetical protein
MSPRTIWQLPGGPASWSYAEEFLRYGVGFIGPGDPGAWGPERKDEEFEGHFVRHFAEEMLEGDVVVLRKGLQTITAIGVVSSSYLYLDQFSDVNGCDLQHTRRIRWCRLHQEHKFDTPVFGAIPSRLSRTSNKEVIDFAERFLNSPPTLWQEAPLPDLPETESDLDLDSVPPRLRDMVALAQDLSKLYWNRDEFGDLPREDELVSHFVIPLLRTLGWSPEMIAVKWQDVDIAVFRCLPRAPENCQFIVEAKRIGEGVESALDQAKRYLKQLGVLRDIIVTDGVRYRMYSAENDFKPIAYANLVWLKQSATELFERMKRL